MILAKDVQIWYTNFYIVIIIMKKQSFLTKNNDEITNKTSMTK